LRKQIFPLSIILRNRLSFLVRNISVIAGKRMLADVHEEKDL